MSTLYVVEPGARLEKEYHRLAVYKQDALLRRVPLAQVSDVVMVGSVGMTTQTMVALLEAGIPLSIIRSRGELLGRLVPATLRNLPLRHKQYRRSEDPEFCLAISRAIVMGKLRNQRTLVRRIFRDRGSAESLADSITEALEMAELAGSLDRLRGLEGSAAKAYFEVFRESLAEGWESPRQSRRPPKDPLNALLSLGYTLLGQAITAALEIAGLDPYDGFFHADKYGRPALALDLVEEFRTPVADSVVLTVINKRILTPADFEEQDGGVRLKPYALRKFLEQYANRIRTEVMHPVAQRRLTYQKCFEVQARLLRHAIEEGADVYEPFRIK